VIVYSSTRVSLYNYFELVLDVIPKLDQEDVRSSVGDDDLTDVGSSASVLAGNRGILVPAHPPPQIPAQMSRSPMRREEIQDWIRSRFNVSTDDCDSPFRWKFEQNLDNLRQPHAIGYIASHGSNISRNC